MTTVRGGGGGKVEAAAPSVVGLAAATAAGSDTSVSFPSAFPVEDASVVILSLLHCSSSSAGPFSPSSPL